MCGESLKRAASAIWVRWTHWQRVCCRCSSTHWLSDYAGCFAGGRQNTASKAAAPPTPITSVIHIADYPGNLELDVLIPDEEYWNNR